MAFEETKLVSIIKHDGISIMICEYFATAHTGKPVLVHITLYYERYHVILNESVGWKIGINSGISLPTGN